MNAADRPNFKRGDIDGDSATRDNHYARWAPFSRTSALQNMPFTTRQLSPVSLRLRQARTRAASCGIENGLVT